MRKRGQSLAANQIVGLVLAIIGFIVVIFLLASLDFKNYSEDEACRLSVLSRATGESKGLSRFSGIIPLQCTTGKICISNDGSECSQFFGEGDVENVRLKGSVEEKSDQISGILAESFFNCWHMMGEGKLDLFSGIEKAESVTSVVGGEISDVLVYTESIKPKCVICSRVALAEDLSGDERGVEERAVLNGVDMERYMATNKPFGSDFTYLQLLSGDPSLATIPSTAEKIVEEGKETETGETDEIAIIFSQIITPEGEPIDVALSSAGNTGLAVGSTLFFSPIGKISRVAGPIKGLLINAGLTITASTVSGAVSYFNAQEGQDVAAYHCGDFVSEKESRNGCSVVKLYDYNNIKGINNFCSGGIDGNP